MLGMNFFNAAETAAKAFCNHRAGSFGRSFDHNLPQS
jgi:hypothetical protein